MMVKTVETRFDVSLDKPHRSFEVDINVLERGVAALFGPKPVGVGGEIGFVDTFKNHTDNFLHQLVARGGNAQRPFFVAVFLGNVFPPCGVGLITVVFE